MLSVEYWARRPFGGEVCRPSHCALQKGDSYYEEGIIGDAKRVGKENKESEVGGIVDAICCMYSYRDATWKMFATNDVLVGLT